MLVSAIKIQFQASKFSLETILIRTNTNIAKVWKYTEQSLVEPLFEVATKIIARSGTNCVGISL